MIVPDPWQRIGCIGDLILVRRHIAERGRYYHHHRTIVVREGLLLCEERAVLWHELVHAERGDERCTTMAEASVDREAARRAMPWPVLKWGLDTASCDEDLVERMKVEAAMVAFRFKIMHPAERAYAIARRAEREDAA